MKSKLMLNIRATMAGQLYEWQELRKDCFNRMRDILYRAEFGIGLNEKQDKKEKKEYPKDFEDSKLNAKFKELKGKNNLDKEEEKFVEKLMELGFDTKKKEKEYKALVEKTVIKEPIWTEFLEHLKGTGMLSTAILVYFFNYCSGINYVSSLWQYSGYGFDNENGEIQKHKKGETSSFNPKLKMFMYRIGDCFIKHRTPLYRDIYDKEKARQVKMMEEKTGNYPSRLGHADMRARRKMIKVFLEHYFVKCKRIIGEEVKKPYQFDKLGHKKYIDVDDFIEELKKQKLKKEIGV